MSTKSGLIKALEINKEHFLSGQELAHKLDVSRTSIWKAVKELQEEGYPIEAVTNKGYMLTKESRILSAEAIGVYLNPAAQMPAIKILKMTDSTNNEAKRMIMNDAGPGTVIFAEEQTKGKGRLGRSFSSPTGDNLYASFILKPLLDVNDSLLITVGASVAVARAVKKMEEFSNQILKPEIKWVNDVYVEGKKICGILTEAVSDVESGQIHSLVLGIGININTDIKDYPEDIRKQIGILKIDPGQRNRFAAILIDEVFNVQEEIYEFSSSELKEPTFMDEYREMSLILKKEIFVIKGDEKLEATALDINSQGALSVKYKTGAEEVLSTGEVSIRLNNQ